MSGGEAEGWDGEENIGYAISFSWVGWWVHGYPLIFK